MIHWTRGRKNKYEKEEYCCVSVTTAVIWEEIKLSHSFHQAENGFSLTPIGDEMTSDTVNNGKYLSKVHLLKCYIIYLLYFSSEGNIGHFFTPISVGESNQIIYLNKSTHTVKILCYK